ncbi:hypothetical protein SDRG_04225 [Saprolegnia diclina VS20]|uniref:WW domain-containing protein n=1 Tax=Saprolegnia diclina (strain VS20) TaxID=1156394 RepID=T0S0S3_SAPDV|nr:hypothetical protein SDRG_04225 [Saprolegnia diclina VS20]EQC38518.1 hypothetical protein SDRG_04225 [Saprolegnia diclina VS20]|eukprot:XP_008608110.1 hypothetical protein SDRG_04225 [Saprolegnia diclina VS20]
MPPRLRSRKRKPHMGIRLDALPPSPTIARAQDLLAMSLDLAYKELPPELLRGTDVDLSMWTLIAFDSCMARLAALQSPLSNQLPESPSSKTPQRRDMKLNLRNGEHITDAGVLCVLRTMGPLLQSLVLSRCPQLTDGLVRAVAGACTYLRRLDLSHMMTLEGAGVAAIGDGCAYLEDLSLSGCRQLPEYALIKVTHGCRRLRALDVAHCVHATDALLTALSQHCPRLHCLNLNGCKEVSDQGLHAVANACLDLTRLELQRSEFLYKITDMCLLSLSEHCKVLQYLDVSGCDHITDAGLSWLGLGCAALTHVDISGCSKLTDYALRALAEGCLQLTTLDISLCVRMTDVGLHLISLGCHELSTLRMKGLVLASAGTAQAEPHGLAALGLRCTQLQHIDLTKCPRVDDVRYRLICLRCHHLLTLTLTQCTKISSDGVSVLAAHCVKLTVMVLNECALLETLKLRNCDRISSGGLQRVCHGCHLLTSLDLTGCGLVDDMGLLAICDGLLKLQYLWLVGLGRITMVGISWLADRCTHLMHLDVSVRCHSAISFMALKPLRAAWKYGALREMGGRRGLFPQHRANDMLFIDEYGHCWKAAIKIQCLYRCKVARRAAAAQRDDALMRWAARRIQSVFRGRQARRYVWVRRMQLRKQTQAATLIQSTYRAKRAREEATRRRHRAEEAYKLRMVVRIQTSWRSYVARRELATLRQLAHARAVARDTAARVLQHALRCFTWRQRCRAHHEVVLAHRRKQDAAARKLQTIYRGRAARHVARRLRQDMAACMAERDRAATLLQRALRRRRERRLFFQRVHRRVAEAAAATRVQRRFRARRAMLQHQTLQLLLHKKALALAARKVQSAWRRKQGRMGMQMLKFLKDAAFEARSAATTKLQTIYRGRRARLHAAQMQRDAMLRLLAEAKMQHQCATRIQAGWRGKKGRDRSKAAVLARKKRWKEVPNPENGTKTYYHQDTGEIRHRMPQDMLDLLPRPKCNDCDIADAANECQDCQEFFCKACWEAIHAGGRRRRHAFRTLYDYYDKRIDYGDGEFPSLWPSEMEQDELDGWFLRVGEYRTPNVVLGDWEKYIDHETKREWYFNVSTKVSSYVPPDAFTASADDIAMAWVRKVDVTNNVTYYLNQKTGQRTFDRPSAFAEPTADDVSIYAPVQLGEWTQYWDEANQVYYYFNSVTLESTYTPPTLA